MIFRYVPHDRVLAYLNLGWHIACADLDHHSRYSILMQWCCDCPMVEPL